MDVYTQLPQLCRSPVAGTVNPTLWKQGIGFRIAPAPPPFLASPTLFCWPRTVCLIDSEDVSKVIVPDTGWIVANFRGIQFQANDKGVGANLTDYWNVWIAEDERDMLAAPGSSFTAGLVYDTATGLYTSPPESPAVTVSSGTVSISGEVPTVSQGASSFTLATVTTTGANQNATPATGTGRCIGFYVVNAGTVAGDFLSVSDTAADLTAGNLLAMVPFQSTSPLIPYDITNGAGTIFVNGVAAFKATVVALWRT